MNKFYITSDTFLDNGWMPIKCTGRGEDISPQISLHNIAQTAVSIAIIMDDLDIPVMGSYTHWVIFNIPPTDNIGENIPYGEIVPTLGNAIQGIGYGKHRYRGPKIPPFIRKRHRYVFQVYVLDTMLDLESSANKRDVLKHMKGHVLQSAKITGIQQNGKKNG